MYVVSGIPRQMAAQEQAQKRRKVQVQSADALDDDLEYEVGSDTAAELETITPNDGSDEDSHSGGEDDDEDDDEADEEEDGAEASEGRAQSSKVEKVKVMKKVLTAEEKRSRRKLRKEVTKKRKAQELGEDEDASGSHADHDGDDTTGKTAKTGSDGYASLGPDQQADLFARLLRDHHGARGLSSIELSDLTLPASAFVETLAFSGPRTLKGLLPFLRRFSHRESLAVANKEPGRPHTLVLAASAIRVADLVRALRPLRPATHGAATTTVTTTGGGDGRTSTTTTTTGTKKKKGTSVGEVAKLFGKEKVGDQEKFLSSTRINIAVGVPGRVSALVDRGALKVDRVEQVFCDATYRDPKNRGMLQIREVVADVVRVVVMGAGGGGGDGEGEGGLGARIRRGECQVVLF